MGNTALICVQRTVKQFLWIETCEKQSWYSEEPLVMFFRIIFNCYTVAFVNATVLISLCYAHFEIL